MTPNTTTSCRLSLANRAATSLTATSADKYVLLPYDWLPFDRKYVIQPPLDFGLAYPTGLTDPHWPTA